MKIGDMLSPEQYALEILNAIETVEGKLPEDGNDVEEALAMAKRALEKQDAKPAVYYDNCGNKCASARCPRCFEIVGNNYCGNCGQRIE